MRIETRTVKSPVYEIITNTQGEQQLGELIRIETGTVTEITADEGKRFVRKSDGALLGDKITLGTDDSDNNYIEV